MQCFLSLAYIQVTSFEKKCIEKDYWFVVGLIFARRSPDFGSIGPCGGLLFERRFCCTGRSCRNMQSVPMITLFDIIQHDIEIDRA